MHDYFQYVAWAFLNSAGISREQRSSIKELDQRIEKVNRDITYFGKFLEKSFTFMKDKENIETTVFEMTEKSKALKERTNKNEEDIKTLFKGLEEKISISSSSIGSLKAELVEGMKIMSERLIKIETNQSSFEIRLTKLEDYCYVQQSEREEEEKREQRLKNNRYTKELDNETVDMSRGRYKLENIDELAEAIKDNRIVKALYLNNNEIGDTGAESISEALKVNKSITQLYLSNIQIGDRGAESISEALKVNKSINILVLDNNQIGDRGAESISEALKVNKSITTLYLSNSQIGDRGAESLSEALKVNKSITILYLNDNQISPSLLEKIANQIKK